MRPRRQQSCSEYNIYIFNYFLTFERRSHWSRFLLFQPLPAASLLPGRSDQQQAFSQDGPPAVVADVVHLLREAVIPAHLPDPPETSAQPVMDRLEGDRRKADDVRHHSVWFNEDDTRFRTKGLHVFNLISGPLVVSRAAHTHQTHFQCDTKIDCPVPHTQTHIIYSALVFFCEFSFICLLLFVFFLFCIMCHLTDSPFNKLQHKKSCSFNV